MRCPYCDHPLEVVVDDGMPIGTVKKRECSEGHAFWIRLDLDGISTFVIPPDR